MTTNDPFISVIVAAYNVSQYITATLKSFELQTSGLDRIEIIIVNDGSTDNTLEIAKAWAGNRDNVVVLDKKNGGAASARKLGIESASGTWVTSVDPDDILDSRYFDSIFEFLKLDTANRSNLLVTRILSLNDETGRTTDNHPLRFRFKHGTRIVSLVDEPDMIQLGATALLRRDVLIENGLNYDVRIEPTFEDAHLIGRYLATFQEPLVGVIPRAKYYYRKRADASSLVQSSWSKHERFSTVLRFGYLDLLRQVEWTYGYVPTWAQNMVLYDIFWYFKEDASQYSRAAWIDDELRQEFLGLLQNLFEYISVATIKRFWINPVWWTLRQVLITYFKCDANELRVIKWSSSDKKNESNFTILQHPEYNPSVEIWYNGELVAPNSENYVLHTFFGVPMLREYSFTVPRGRGKYTFIADEVRYSAAKAYTKVPSVNINHSKIQLSWDAASTAGTVRQPYPLRRIKNVQKTIRLRSLTTGSSSYEVLKAGLVSYASNKIKKAKKARAQILLNRILVDAKKHEVRLKYANAWCIMDRPDKADDNGEHFYRFLMNNHPEVNAFFVLKKSSSDWNRLQAEGFNLLEPGSNELSYAILNADYRISSDAVAPCMYPVSRKIVNSGNSKFIFLQHGILMNDLSRWLNPKDISAIVVSSNDEYGELTGKESPYVYRKEQVLGTGLARFDKLKSLRDAKKLSERKRVLVMPTWRQHIRDTASSISSSIERQKYLSGTQFFTEWMKVLHSSELRLLCEAEGMILTFVPHPALRSLINSIDFPPHVEFVDLNVTSIQEVLAESALFVTDYSSVSFDAAYIKCPTVYFQFDYDEVFSGRHNFRPGYFDYKSDGMGPVLENADSTIETIRDYVTANFDDSTFAARRSDVFINVDNQNCARIFSRILSI